VTGPRAQARDVVPVLTGYLLLLEIVPSGWVVPSFGDVGTPANIYALLALIWYAASWLAGRVRPAAGSGAPRLALCAFAAAVLLGYLSLSDPTRQAVGLETQAADRGLIGLAAWAGVLLIASAGIREYAELQRVLRRAVLYGSGIGALGILEFFTSKDLLASVHVPGLRTSTSVSELITRGSFIRPSSNTSQPLELAAVLALLLPFAIQQAFEPGRTGLLRRWLPVALIGGAMPLTVSRTSIIGLFVVLVLLVPTWPAQRRWPALGVLAVGVGLLKVAVPGLLSTTVGLFSSFLGNSDNSTQARTADYSGVAQYVQQRPLFGRGYGTFIPSLYRYTDNMYLLALVEIGAVGVFALLLLYLTGWRCGRLGRRLCTDPSRRELGQSFAAAMAAALVLSATFDSLGFPMFAGLLFLLLGLSGAYLGIARRERAAPTGPGTVQRLPKPVAGVPELAAASAGVDAGGTA
jgi:O-antigen ligase